MIRVIGSHDISTSFLDSGCVGARVISPVAMSHLSYFLVWPTGVIACRKLRLVAAPLRLSVDRRVGDVTQPPKHGAIALDHRGRYGGSWWLIHERHELVREPRHRAANADAPDVRATA